MDATFLRRDQRRSFRDLAAVRGVPFVIIDCDAPADVLRQRIRARWGEGDNVSDADLGVLDAQLASCEGLSDEEKALSLRVRPDEPLDRERLQARLVGNGG